MLLENAGLDYENHVTKIVKKATGALKNIAVIRSSGGGFSAHDADLSIKIKNKLYGIEIKADNRSQMGSISIGFTDNKFIVKSDLDPSIKAIAENVLIKKTPDILKILKFFEKNDPIFKFNKARGFPINVSEDSWKSAVELGLVKNINAYIKDDVAFIERHYTKKGINYIQIGGHGLFSIGRNVLKLPIPELDGELVIEFRAAKSGKKFNKTLGVEYSTVILRMVGRLSFTGHSGISLDDPQQCSQLFDKLNQVENESFYNRSEMPQVSQDEIDILVKAKIGRMGRIAPTKLRATQKDFDYDKIRHMQNNNPHGKPIIISNDFYICDGHHTWLAHDWNQPIRACMIDKPWNQCIKFLKTVF